MAKSGALPVGGGLLNQFDKLSIMRNNLMRSLRWQPGWETDFPRLIVISNYDELELAFPFNFPTEFSALRSPLCLLLALAEVGTNFWLLGQAKAEIYQRYHRDGPVNNNAKCQHKRLEGKLAKKQGGKAV